MSRKPDAAAAQPEYELSIETTTGMSPPPIEATRCQPSSSASTVTAISSGRLGEITKITVSTTNATSAPMLIQFLPGSISGADLILADSFR